MSVAPPRQPGKKSRPNGLSSGSVSPSAKSPTTLPSSFSEPRSNLRPSDPNSQSFQNLTSSALSGLFGSHVTLAELTGDSVSSRTRATRPGNQPEPTSNIDNNQNFLDETNRSLTEVVNGTAVKRRRGSMSYPSSAVSSTRKHRSIVNHHASLPSLSSNNDFVRISIPTLIVRVVALFAFGVAYGELARNLHDNHQVTNETLNIAISQNSAIFSLAWGAQGILLGFLLPLFDWMFPSTANSADSGKGGTDWSSIIRAIAAFLGVAYGVRKLPWESSMQVAALWGLVNPFLWYLLDATRNGFILSALVAIVGTTVFAFLFPSHLPKAEFSPKYITVAVWVASVYFICSICFGNLGRRILSFGAKAK